MTRGFLLFQNSEIIENLWLPAGRLAGRLACRPPAGWTAGQIRPTGLFTGFSIHIPNYSEETLSLGEAWGTFANSARTRRGARGTLSSSFLRILRLEEPCGNFCEPGGNLWGIRVRVDQDANYQRDGENPKARWLGEQTKTKITQ